MKQTEYKLSLWREGQVNAERLCADILILEGFTSVDLQCPLGGPDGLKDVICEKSGWTYIGASFFPTKQQSFVSIKNKFIHDIAGVLKNKTNGMVFLTNQHITPKQKKSLQRTLK